MGADAGREWSQTPPYDSLACVPGEQLEGDGGTAGASVGGVFE